MNDQRLAIVVSPATREEVRGEQGTLDGDAMRERLGLPDAGFEVVSLDAERDLAEQIDALFDARKSGECAVVFYASTFVSAADGEFFLCLDPAAPDTGDALHDVVEVLRDRISGPLLVVLETRHEVVEEGPLESVELAGLARSAVRSVGNDVELIIAAHTVNDEKAMAPSPFTRAVLEILDESDPMHGLNALEIYETLADGRLLGVVKAIAHAPIEDSFMVVPARPVEIDVAEDFDAPDEPDTDQADVPNDTPEPSVAEPVAAADSVALAQSADVAEKRSEPIRPQPIEAGSASTPLVETRLADTPLVDALPSTSSSVDEAPKSQPPRGGDAAPLSRPPPSSTPISQAPMSQAPMSQPPPSGPRSFPPTAQADVDSVLEEARRMLHAPDYEGALGAYRRALGLGSLGREARGHVYLKMGTVKALQGKVSEAIANLEKALTLVEGAQTARVLGELLTLYNEEKDHRAAAATQERILKALPDDGSRFKTLLKYGRGWMALPEERMRARQMLERAERIDSDNLELLEMLRDLGQADGRIEDVLALRRRIAEGTQDPKTRAKLLAELAFDLHKRGREDEALKLFDTALDEDPSKLEPLATIAEILSERQEWAELEASYRRMLTRLPRLEPVSVRRDVACELNRRLGLVLRDHLDDVALALEAFEQAVEAKPGDASVHKMAVDLARQVDDSEATKRHLLALSVLEPREPRVFRLLFETFMRENDIERAADAAAVLVVRGIALDRERVVFESSRPDDVPKFGAPLTEEGWSKIAHRDHSSVSAIFESVGAAAAAALSEVIKRTQSKRLPDERLKVDPDASTVSAVRSLAWAARTLGLPAPMMYLDDQSSANYAALLADPPATRLGSGVLRGRSRAELAFLAGRHVTYHAPHHRLLALSPSIEDLSACFLAAVSLATGDVTGPESMRRVVGDLAPRVETWLGAEELARLKIAVAAFTEAGGRADLSRYVASVERTSMRAGLLLAGDLGVGVSLAKEGVFDGGYRDALTEPQRVDELVSFAVSDTYAELRLAMSPEEA